MPSTKTLPEVGVRIAVGVVCRSAVECQRRAFPCVYGGVDIRVGIALAVDIAVGADRLVVVDEHHGCYLRVGEVVSRIDVQRDNLTYIHICHLEALVARAVECRIAIAHRCRCLDACWVKIADARSVDIRRVVQP